MALPASHAPSEQWRHHRRLGGHSSRWFASRIRRPRPTSLGVADALTLGVIAGRYFMIGWRGGRAVLYTSVARSQCRTARGDCDGALVRRAAAVVAQGECWTFFPVVTLSFARLSRCVSLPPSRRPSIGCRSARADLEHATANALTRAAVGEAAPCARVHWESLTWLLSRHILSLHVTSTADEDDVYLE